MRGTLSTALPDCGKIGGGWRSGGKLCWRATCPGIANWKLIERLWAEAGSGSLLPTVLLLSIDFPMPPKLASSLRRQGAVECDLIAVGFMAVTCRSTLTPCKQEPDGTVPVGSEGARFRAGLRPPLKLYVPISGIQLSRGRPRAGGRTERRYQRDEVYQAKLLIQLHPG